MTADGQARPWIVVSAAVLLLLLGGVSFVLRVRAVEPSIGVDWAQSSTCPVAVSVDPQGAAAAAGLREGDCLLAVDGREASSSLDAGEIGWDAPVGEGLSLKVRRGDVEWNLDLHPYWKARDEPYAYLALVGLAFGLSGLFIALRWPAIRGGTVYAILAACLFGVLTMSHTGRADALDWSVYWLDRFAAALVPALLLHVAVALTKRTLTRRRATLALAYASSTALLLWGIWLSPATLGGAYRFTDPTGILETPDRLASLLMGLSMLVTTGLFLRSYANSSSVMHRSQMRWLLLGSIVGLGPFVMLDAIPFALGAAPLPGWAKFLVVLPLLLVPVTFTAALVRYRLYDLDLFLLRGLSEITTLFFSAAVYAAVFYLVREALGGVFPVLRGSARYVAILVAAVSFSSVRAWVRSMVDYAVYRQRYSYRATLLDWARELSTETDLAALLQGLKSRVRDTLGVQHAEVLIRTGPWRFETVDGLTDAAPLELDQASLAELERVSSISVEAGALAVVPWARYLFSLKVKGRVRAVLAISERVKAEEPLTTEDRALLGTLAAHAGTAIEAARLVLEVRKRAEEIERLHARQERILESSAVGLLLLDRQERILAWNRALEEMYGLPRKEAIGCRLSDVFPLNVVRRIEREGRSVKTEESRIFRLSMVNRQGRRLVLNIAISPADGGDGGRVVTFDDVTEHVELEEQVLQQERLASLGLLAAGVAHEINTPLTGVSGYTQLLLEESDSADPKKEVLEKIEVQTRRASGIVNSLLTLARPERTAFEMLDLNEAIREALQLFEPQIRGRDIRLNAHLDKRLTAVRGHRGKLQQVLLNLLLNARDAVGDGGEITVATSCGNGKALIEVTDDGAGISEEDLPRIFDPFFSTKGRGKGTGLGLSVTYGIVQEHDGEIRAESGLGGPTRFRVELPMTSTARAMA